MLLAFFFAFALADSPPEWTVSNQSVFRTEPSIVVEYFAVDILTNDISELSPGYLFIDPIAGGGTLATGPQIYTQDGQLVWHQGLDPGHRVQDFHACDYLGHFKEHLCWSEMVSVNDINNRNPAMKMVYDSSYRMVQALNITIGDAPPNLHDFNTVDNGTSYIQPVYPAEYIDLTEYGGLRAGVMWDGCFQDIDFATHKVKFRWCWRDHMPIWHTTIWFTDAPNITNITSPKAGKGDWASPFDPYHLNAIDKNEEGDYLLSARHMDAVVKVAGTNRHGVAPGTILWQLGGKANQISKNFTFGKQHHCRFRMTGAEETVISFLDNSWDNSIGPINNVSSGLLIAVNNVTKTARIVHDYPHPTGLMTGSQASMQVLPNRNVFIGWGDLPQISEYSENGKVLFHATWRRFMEERKEHSYRAFKAPWIGRPLTRPKLIAYSKACTVSAESPLVAWVSWNGATEVKTWKFLVAVAETGPWIDAGRFSKINFETETVLQNTTSPKWLQRMRLDRTAFVTVEAIDSDGHVLGSTTTAVFVPRADISEHCGAFGCYEPRDRFKYDSEQSCGLECGHNDLPQYAALLLVIILIECLDRVYLWAARLRPAKRPSTQFERPSHGSSTSLSSIRVSGHRPRPSYSREQT